MGFTVKFNEKRNKWVWRARVSFNGKQHEKSGSANDRIDAELEGSQVYAKLVKEKSRDMLVIDKKITLGDLMIEWFNTCKRSSLSRKSIVTYEGNMKKHIIPEIGSVQVTKLNRVFYQKFINKLVSQMYTKGTIRLINSLVVSCLEFAIHDLRLIDYNPAKKINIPVKKSLDNSEEKNKFYTDEDLKAMFIAADKIILKAPDKASLADLLRFLPNSGLRISEALGLLESDYTETHNKVSIDKQLSSFSTLSNPLLVPVKTSTSNRDVFLDNRTSAMLKKRILKNKEHRMKHPELKKEHLFLFSYRGRHIYKEQFRVFIEKVCKESGVHYHKKHAIHALRHTHVKKLVESGVPEISIQQRIGHSKNSVVTKSYMHADEKMAKVTIEQYEKFISASN
ncbi:tyrosine-type recombinase/integrase [Paenilisteria rocourtiae]|nr:site-specific integrase [Listeria rocourtiae]